MYFPPYRQLVEAAKKNDSLHNSGKIVLSVDLFKFLLQAALATTDFDEKNYLAANPDVRSNLARSKGLTPMQHFLGFGYFEGRKGGMPKVDEQWYLQTYNDVARAVEIGLIASATEHFEVVGAAEGRAPSADYLDVARQWKLLLDS